MHRLILLGAITAVASLADPVQWTVASGGNGHWYDLISQPSIFYPATTFEGALADATSRTHLGMQGYLATVTSAAEAQFLYDNFSILVGFGGDGTAFLGANSLNAEGEMRWIGGPEAGQALTYAPWVPGHPVPLAGFEYLQLGAGILHGSFVSTASAYGWGHFVEYSASAAPPPPPPTGLPEPSAWATLAGVAALIRYRAPFKR